MIVKTTDKGGGTCNSIMFIICKINVGFQMVGFGKDESCMGYFNKKN